jgi:hypothetical protein
MLAPLDDLHAVLGCNRSVVLAELRARQGDRAALFAALEQGGTTRMSGMAEVSLTRDASASVASRACARARAW